ncbi:unnamed protein product [Closterium sp. Naga37s-1]|nr:unnamed protein product [Closterium sp. Naga37s-1]
MASSAVPRHAAGARTLAGSVKMAAVALGAAGAAINGGISAVVGAGSRAGGSAGAGEAADGQASSPKGAFRGAGSPRASGGLFPRHAAANYLCLMLPFLALSTLQLYLMWLPELGPMRLPQDDFVGSKSTKSRAHQFNYRTLLAHTASDVRSLHKLLEQSRRELKGQVAAGIKKMGLEMLQTKQDSARGAADVADWWQHEQGRLKAMSQDVGQLKDIVGQHARKLEAQVRAVQEASGSSEEQQGGGKDGFSSSEEQQGDKGGDEDGEVARPEQWQKGRQEALMHFWVADDRPSLWKQRSFQRHGSFGFIKFSAYRVNASTLAVLGLASLPMHHGRRFSSCRWHASAPAAADNGGVGSGGGGVTEGMLVPLYVEEHHDYLYEAVVVLCVLDAPSPASGGVLEAEIDGEVLFPFVEQPGQSMEDPSTFPNNIVFCGPPMFGAISPRALTEWLHFHRLLLPVDHFVLYDAGGVADHADVSSAVQPWVRAGVVEVVGFEESTQYDVWSYAQALSTHDCLYGNRHGARWLLFADLDEFVEVLPPATLQQLLQDNAGRPWITFGCTWPHAYCMNTSLYPDHLCLDQFGHRKYVLNPRRVSLAQIHVIIGGDMDGLDLPTDVARFAHYRGLTARGYPMCDLGAPSRWWRYHDGVARMAQAARSCPALVAPVPERCTAQALASSIA